MCPNRGDCSRRFPNGMRGLCVRVVRVAGGWLNTTMRKALHQILGADSARVPAETTPCCVNDKVICVHAGDINDSEDFSSLPIEGVTYCIREVVQPSEMTNWAWGLAVVGIRGVDLPNFGERAFYASRFRRVGTGRNCATP